MGSKNKIIPFKKYLQILIAEKLMSIEILNINETMRKSILTDKLGVLIEIRKYQTIKLKITLLKPYQVNYLIRKQKTN